MLKTVRRYFTVSGTEDMVLDYINGIRDKKGVKPLAQLPAGERKQGSSCVLAQALSDVSNVVMVGEAKIALCDKSIVVEGFANPKFVKEFIHDFDEGYYPHLEKGADPARETLVYKMDTKKSNKKKEDVDLHELEQRLEGLERSHEATAKELRQKIREMKQEQQNTSEYKELPV